MIPLTVRVRALRHVIIVAAAIVMATPARAQAPPAVTAPPTASDRVPFDAEAIFERARDAWTSQQYPERLSYVVAVDVRQDGKELHRHYRGERAPNGDMRVYAFSDEETASPYVPHGINVDLAFTLTQGGSETLARTIGAAPPAIDYLGVPVVQPGFSFGLARAVTTFPGAQGTGEVSNLRTIGHVASRQRRYDVTLIATERCAGAQAYHLALRALRDPKRFRIREMWVDAMTFATRKIVTEGNFTDGPPLRVTWATTFQQIDGVQYIDTESTDAMLDYGPGRRYAGATISFEAITAEASTHATPLLIALPARSNELREPDT